MNFSIDELTFDEKGLIPAIVQNVNTGKVLMLAYMNKESLQKTIETNTTWFYSRSRQQLWNKGETSGNTQNVKRMSYDCDGDTLLVEVEPMGNACHTGAESCFFNDIDVENKEEPQADREIIDDLYRYIQDRRENPVEGSYTNYLFRKGLDKILKKVGEEATEVIIGAKNRDQKELINEFSDLVYHSIVLMVEQEISVEDIKRELTNRHKKQDYEPKREPKSERYE
ncbi:bifunctional phosphoribosyl-AMP cyclohydrolase/phosphoribosyl-ATP diphosphatase HisIE [Virgibacillus sp. MSP4-1]|uniref:bifunctional phosphoribosyl-AMP cyclohydrolase/phosphoribosyl-ATP diphosphatase HisIE n=1 Tax=Virgibacillus sp. MSP4-1 TaxID=2700081 RepID=UPI0003A41B6C|nr:bifunctional phosphoribosyl-AMP cyclohydrolase/phosphoribosyl-ATP diphosphatase HisIE [Virgibacillus sp. MSP4-1]QHS24090.1 bifunctional phosphoribosyl-AMP cyclohydrolase/phosphoribosyl-ATP diphosphatase HisIE [Virgibacillus sp. MSP4-1]